MQEEFDNIIELVDDEGEEVRFGLIAVLEHEGDTYLALEVLDEEDTENDEGDAEVVFMLVTRDENEEDCYEPVTDDDLNETLFELFLEKLDESEEAEGENDGEGAE
ncbi:MAG: DUF1292 domain-containing protein [Clostridia bacterium]|nr:DUF1292 domain-containing protein [Clostridia bacterium]MBR4458040.1 DUF1292 domain-containing protein [Clostridia bacterium]